MSKAREQVAELASGKVDGSMKDVSKKFIEIKAEWLRLAGGIRRQLRLPKSSRAGAALPPLALSVSVLELGVASLKDPDEMVKVGLGCIRIFSRSISIVPV